MDDFEKEFKLETTEEISDNLTNLGDILEKFDDESDQEVWNDNIDELFRVFHSIKGNAKSADFSSLAEVTHKFEDLLLTIKNKEVSGTEKIVDVLFAYNSEAVESLEQLKVDLEHTYNFDNLYNRLSDI